MRTFSKMRNATIPNLRYKVSDNNLYFAYGAYKCFCYWWYVLNGMNSDKEMFRRSQLEAANVTTDSRRADCAPIHGGQISSTFRRGARVSQFQPSSLTPFMREKRARSPLDSNELARDIRWKERFSGERWERRAETIAIEARRDESQRRNKNKRREAIRLKVWTGTH